LSYILFQCLYIFRRYYDNIIELEENSEDYNLYGNKVQITVANEILLPNVVIKEQNENVFIFLATTTSVHQLTLTHPNHQKYVSTLNLAVINRGMTQNKLFFFYCLGTFHTNLYGSGMVRCGSG